MRDWRAGADIVALHEHEWIEMTALGTTVERRICKYCPAKMIRPNRDAPWVVDMIKVDPS